VAEPGSDKPRGRGKSAPILDALMQGDALTPPLTQSIGTPLTQSGTPPMAQLLRQLEALLKAVAHLVEQSEEQQQVPARLTELRETLIESGTTWENQSREMQSMLDVIQQRVAQGPPSVAPGPWRWLACVASGAVGAVLVGVAWFCWPAPPLAQLGALLNQTMVQQYGQLPKAVQESVTLAYQRTGFRTPVAQQKETK
jgi:hypothetical protein